jgi:hypothetical protein
MCALKLGKLETLKATDVWGNEPQVFTPWLAQNLALLGESLHLGELELLGTETRAGDFRLDILAEDDEGNLVLVENQFGPTDHKHLGQIITYVASQRRPATVVWVAEKFREDHRAAIDWLNASTIEDFDFFGVEIEALKIGDSDPAPYFNVVAKPNNWARIVSRKTCSDADTASPGRRSFYLEYWGAFLEQLANTSKNRLSSNARGRNRYRFSAGRSGFAFVAVINIDEKSIRFGLHMMQRGLEPKEAFTKLSEQKAEIEAELGRELIWEELLEITASRVVTFLKDVDIEDRESWPRQHQWIIDQLGKFRSVFVHRVRSLKLSRDDGSMDDDTSDDSQE